MQTVILYNNIGVSMVDNSDAYLALFVSYSLAKNIIFIFVLYC
jgi:hypothetical protein